MIFSKTWSYAVRALIHLAKHHGQAPVLSSTIAEQEQIPGPFLAKILGSLAAADIVISTRGPKGGFVLKVEPEELTLLFITDIIGSKDSYKKCLLGFDVCPENGVCPVHKRWKEPHNQIIRFLKETTLADIALAQPKILAKTVALIKCDEVYS